MVNQIITIIFSNHGNIGIDKMDPDDLSDDEAHEKLEDLIHKMDENGDTNISKEELIKWLIHSFT